MYGLDPLHEASRRTHEEVVCIRIWSPNLEELHQIVELTMYVAAHSDGAFLC